MVPKSIRDVSVGDTVCWLDGAREGIVLGVMNTGLPADISLGPQILVVERGARQLSGWTRADNFRFRPRVGDTVIVRDGEVCVVVSERVGGFLQLTPADLNQTTRSDVVRLLDVRLAATP